MERQFLFLSYRYFWLLSVFIVPKVPEVVGVVDNTCLKNVKLLKKEATSLTLSWNFYCDNYAVSVYKIYYEHQDWLACPDQKSDSRPTNEKSGHMVVNNNTHSIRIHPLHPYSEYKITIKALIVNEGEEQSSRNRLHPDEIKTFLNTSQYTPSIRPELSEKPVVEDRNTLLFSWSQPSPMRCSIFNGKLKGFRYIFKSIDRCNKELMLNGNTSDTSLKVFKHQPIFNYSLYVYIENEMGMINTDLPLIIKGETKVHVILHQYYAPKNVTVLFNQTLLQICWSPSCFQTTNYIIRIQFDRGKDIIQPVHVKDSKIQTSKGIHCFTFNVTNRPDSNVIDVTNEHIEGIFPEKFETLSIEVASISLQGIPLSWSKKVVISFAANNIHTSHLIAILVPSLSIIILLLPLLIYAKKGTRNRLTLFHIRNITNTNSNVADTVNLNNIHQVKQATPKRKFSHLMLPETSEVKMSIVHSPLPPIPTNVRENSNMFRRHDSKNSLVSEDGEYLIPRCDITLHISNIKEDGYCIPTFITSQSRNITEVSEEEHDYIPMKSYL